MDAIQQVQKRPGMYVGSTDDGIGLHNLIYTLVTDFIAASLADLRVTIEVILHSDFSCSVVGFGFVYPNYEDLALIKSSRHEAASSLFDGSTDGLIDAMNYIDVKGGVYGGLCVVNALSEWLQDEVWNSAQFYGHSFLGGYFFREVNSDQSLVLQEPKSKGIAITFLPNRKFFSHYNFDQSRLIEGLATLSHLNGGVSIMLTDNR